MHPDVEAVMAELDAHRARFETFCRSLSDEELDRDVPKSAWKVRDFIAHLGTIDGPVGQMFRSVHAGEDPGIRNTDGARFDVDDWNEGRIQERRTKNVDELLAEAAISRAQLREDLAALNAEDLAENLKFQGDARRPPAEYPLGLYIRGWCKHDPMHAMDMARALPQRLTPDLESWFDDPVVKGYQAQMNSGA